ncbi:MAG: glucuronate isomerase [Oscillospiraceae bacterium]|jgi:glucuronate isomerase|nr:glucuronate isomerase [Oscillospiraceae bacterium]
MRGFMDEDFLLSTGTARTLYRDYASQAPIIDYHCHINPREIAEDRRFDNLTQAWLEADHYKWRAMRCCGVPEHYITGKASEREKFQKFAEVMPRLAGNPLYHWTHLELRRYMGIDTPLSGDTAEEIWRRSREALSELSVRRLIARSRVELIGTTDDPADDLRWHKALRDDPAFDVRVLPTFRPDKAVNIDRPGFRDYAASLGASTLEGLKAALAARLDYFVSLGCRASDHALGYIPFLPAPEGKADAIFASALSGGAVSPADAEIYKTDLMLFLGRQFHERGLVMQLHYGARRDAVSRMYPILGPDSGFDCISTCECSGNLASFLDELDKTDQLPQTIFYSLNPADNAMLASVAGCFHSPGVIGKVQHGSAWWFNDTKGGMERQLTTLASVYPLGSFVGMLTDSRSFMSYTRHEYFRRILCALLGAWAENGEYPADIPALGRLVWDISYANAGRYFAAESHNTSG